MQAIPYQHIFSNSIGIPVGLIMFLGLMILPIPAFVLDICFTSSMVLSMLILLAGIYTLRPLDFEVFPTILLLATLMRLALNIASTRVVLLYGHTGSGAAGKVIEAFGEVVIGGNYAVGFVIFIILVIINFVVVTKGAGRVSEVSARFTLDALPGKQMAIDADLNAGIINQEQAIKRREDLAKEADFYGSMDGASKFIRGDSVAGILILIVNLVGGMLIGMFQHNLNFDTAVEIYALLTIGDGLVSQIPSLILSTASAMMVTRISQSQNLGQQLFVQLFNDTRTLLIVGYIMIGLGLIPGMPHLTFVGFGGILLGIGYFMKHKKEEGLPNQNASVTAEGNANVDEKVLEEISWEDVPTVDMVRLEVGYQLIQLVDEKKSVELLSKIKGIRKQLSQELGFLVPTIHIKDNLELKPNYYRISILGVTIGEDLIYIDRDLAIDPGKVTSKLDGIMVKDPSFGLTAYWIKKGLKQQAQAQGYTVVDASTVIATHLSQLIQQQAHQLIGHEETKKLLDLIEKSYPSLVLNVVPKQLTLGIVVKVLQNLLYEHVPIRDMRSILEALSEFSHKTQDPILLTEAVRANLGRMLVQQVNGFVKELKVIVIEPELEQILQQSIMSSRDSIVLEPNLSKNLQNTMIQTTKKLELMGDNPVLLVNNNLRVMVSKFVRSFLPSMTILAYQEIPDDINIKVVSTIGGSSK